MASAASPGGTFIDTLRVSFVDVPIGAGDAISTTEFLDAAEDLTRIFDLLGSTAFGVVKSDILGNVTKLRTRQLAAPAESDTIQNLVINEKKEKKNTATEGLLWLTRGLQFTCIALSRNRADAKAELAQSFNDAYGETLKKHHNFVVKGVFSVALKAVPYRADFYKKLGEDQEKVGVELDKYLAALHKLVGILEAFLEQQGTKL